MKCIIDRFEGEYAVVEADGSFYNVPKALLPLDAKEGDVLSLEIQRQETRERKKRVEALMEDLFED